MDWIRLSDVVRLAQQSAETRVSRKALLNRWPTREEFLQDAIIFAMCYRDVPASDQVDPTALSEPGGDNLADVIGSMADQVYAALLRHPRSFLLSQVAPYLAHHPEAREAVAASGDQTRREWETAYRRLIELLGLQPRPDWPVHRISVALQCIVDGVIVRHQIQSDLVEGSAWSSASLLSDTVIAFCVGVLDFDGDGESSRAHLDRCFSATRRPPRPS